jgi:putative ATP-dependent endonuclease of the OLD family
MQLRSLKVKNFRSIREVDLELPRICAFVGPNNSGKTNLLEVIRRVLAPEWGPRATHFSEEDVYLRDSSRDIEI